MPCSPPQCVMANPNLPTRDSMLHGLYPKSPEMVQVDDGMLKQMRPPPSSSEIPSLPLSTSVLLPIPSVVVRES